MARRNKEKKWSIKRGDTIYYESCGKIYKTEAMEIDGTDVLTSYGEWENKRMFLRPDNPRINDCVGYQEIVPQPEN